MEKERRGTTPGPGIRLCLAVRLCGVLLLAVTCHPAIAAATLGGSEFALHSSGAAVGEGWRLDESGFIATYLQVTGSEPVLVTVEVSGTGQEKTVPRLRLTLADQSRDFHIAGARASHDFAASLPAGTYLLRIDLRDTARSANRSLTVHRAVISGASLRNTHTDANALETANSYIRNFRRGHAVVRVDGALAGTDARISLVRHAFRFGANVPFAENKLIPSVTPSGSEAERFQQLLLGNFNTVVLSNGGKWAYHEATRDEVQMAYVDRFLEFAAQHGLFARMHTLMWDTDQQPPWVVADGTHPGLLTQALAGNADARRQLLEEIDERIDYYVRQRAAGYLELDVVNESQHRSRYWQLLGDEGFAELFRKVQAAAHAAGSSTRLYLNEYNLLQSSTDPLVPDAPPDVYANWYRRHAEAVLRSGGPVTGLGVQYYADPRLPDELGANAHSAARIMGVLQNLSGTGLPLSLTEFAVNPASVPTERGADILEETLRMAFGTPRNDSFLIWATWEKAAQSPPPLSILLDASDRLTPAGVRYDALMKEWSTQLDTPVSNDGSFEFTGFYGDYTVQVGGKTVCFTLEKGVTEYRLDGLRGAGACN